MFASFTAPTPQPVKAAPVAPTPRQSQPAGILPIHGQPVADAIIRDYLDAPDSRAFLFHGPTGTGKTTTAHYLADRLGVDRSPIGGYEEIASGEQTAEAVRQLARSLRLRPMSGLWRLIVVNEADKMTGGAEAIWLDVLESLPENVTVVFSSNNPEKLSQRFRNRCEEIEFVADESAVREFSRQEWQRLAPGRPVPASVMNAGIRDGWTPSYRLAVKDVKRAVSLAR